MGSSPSLSSKHPKAIADIAGRNAGFQKTVNPQAGQKWNSTDRPLAPIQGNRAQDPVISVARRLKTRIGLVENGKRLGFHILFPEQSCQDNSNLCFNSFQAEDTTRGRGDVQSIIDTIERKTKIKDGK